MQRFRVVYHAIENKGANTIIAAQDGNVGCNTVEYTTAFLYSDWLHFYAWRGINGFQ